MFTFFLRNIIVYLFQVFITTNLTVSLLIYYGAQLINIPVSDLIFVNCIVLFYYNIEKYIIDQHLINYIFKFTFKMAFIFGVVFFLHLKVGAFSNFDTFLIRLEMNFFLIFTMIAYISGITKLELRKRRKDALKIKTAMEKIIQQHEENNKENKGK
ncbi:MAG: hypothetical protein ACOCQR_02075 [bacterium]